MFWQRFQQVCLAGCILALSAGGVWAEDAFRPERFAAEVAPLLEHKCISCHKQPDPKGGLSLETLAQAQTGGESGPAVVPGNVSASLLIDYVTGAEPLMPKGRQALTQDEQSLLQEWIKSGAHWPAELALQDRRLEDFSFWSLAPVAARPLPKLQTDWGRGPVDAFIVQALTERGLTPSQEADSRTLIRRLSFDLRGLPPTYEEVLTFQADREPDAYERLTDRFIHMPAFGERMGRHWLDVAHYADTHGYDKDKVRPNAWPYRDYVIRALNQDLPYGKFIEAQVAGDVLFPDDPQAVIATGFIAAGPWDFVGHVELREGTVDKDLTRVIDRDDMVTTCLSTFLGLTGQCARCHDHPFDPLRQVEYYQMQAVFAGVDRGDRPFVPADQQARLQSLQQRLAEAQAAVNQAAAAVPAGEFGSLAQVDEQIRKAASAPELPADPFDTSALPVDSPTNGYHSAIEAAPNVTKWVQVDLGGEFPLEVVRLIPARPTDFPNTPGFGFPARFKVELASDAEFNHPAVLLDATQADYPNPQDHPVTVFANGARARYVRVTATQLWPRTNDFVFALSELQVTAAGGKPISAGLQVTALDSIEAGRWSTRHLVDGFNSQQKLPDFSLPENQAALAAWEAHQHNVARLVTVKAQALEASHGTPQGDAYRQALARVAALEQALQAAGQPNLVYAVLPHEPREIRQLHRGDVRQPLAAVTASSPACIQAEPFQLEPDAAEGARRAAFARWLAASAQPLTWRCMANRIWQQHFGQALVETTNDLGQNGARPTHPEMLDYLAARLRTGEQSQKRLHLEIVRSAAYRQAYEYNTQANTQDGSNRYLWRANRRRLDAETWHDAMLAASGAMVTSMGGPGYYRFGFTDDHSPRYLYETHDPLSAESRRRAVYRFLVRSVPDPLFDCLDAADASQSVPVRNETITPLQALSLMHNPFVLRHAETLARRAEATSPNAQEQLRQVYHWCLQREPDQAELTSLAAYAQTHGLANTVRVLLNSNEFMFVD